MGAHPHGLVWGKTEEELWAAFHAMGPGFINVKGECAGFVREIDPDEIAGYMRYALKVPLFEYSVKSGERENIDPETGEITFHTKISANPLRPGDQLRMSALLSNMYLDDLIFGQHEGTEIVREIRRRARAPLVLENRLSRLQGKPASAQIATVVNIAPFSRTPISKLLLNPPKKLWLGPRRENSSLGPFLRGQNSSAAGSEENPIASLPELIMN